MAALGVVAYHTNGNVQGAGWLPHFFHAASLYGEIGVDIFFVISGFVIIRAIAGIRRLSSAPGRT